MKQNTPVYQHWQQDVFQLLGSQGKTNMVQMVVLEKQNHNKNTKSYLTS